MKYDIFISYRRDGGYDTAKHLYDLLKNDGYSVSFDIDTLRSGDFDVQLYKRIENCKDFILILDRNVFNRSVDPQVHKEHDWVRCELSHALKCNLNIIPIFLEGFQDFPNNLPDDISGVSKKNGIKYTRDYFDALYSNLKTRFLLSKPKTSPLKKLMAVLIAMAVIIGVWQYYLSENKPNNDDFLIFVSSADSLIKASCNLLDESGETLKSEFAEKMQRSVILYDNSLKCNISDSTAYRKISSKRAVIMKILDSCRTYDDLSGNYMKLMAERSFIAAAECNDQRRNTLQNIKKMLMAL